MAGIKTGEEKLASIGSLTVPIEKSRYATYLYYVRDEIHYGLSLHYSGWKKMLLHPLQTVKDLAYAVCHPLETGNRVVQRFTQHPIGMMVNVSLSWATGHVLGEGVEYLMPEADVSSLPLGLQVPLHNTTRVIEPGLSSTVSHIVQLGSQVMSGGCCGGICTLSQTTAVLTTASSAETCPKTPASEPLPAVWSCFWRTSPPPDLCKKASVCSSPCSGASAPGHSTKAK